MDLTKSNTNLFWYLTSLNFIFLNSFLHNWNIDFQVWFKLLNSSKNWSIFHLGTLEYDLGNAEFQDLERRSSDCFEGCWPKYKSADDFLVVVLKLMKWYWYRVITIEGLPHTILLSLSFPKSQIIEWRFWLNFWFKYLELEK